MVRPPRSPLVGHRPSSTQLETQRNCKLKKIIFSIKYQNPLSITLSHRIFLLFPYSRNPCQVASAKNPDFFQNLRLSRIFGLSPTTEEIFSQHVDLSDIPFFVKLSLNTDILSITRHPIHFKVFVSNTFKTVPNSSDVQ